MDKYLSFRSKSIELSPIREIFEMASKTPGLVRMEVGQPDFPTPEHILEGIKNALLQGHIGYAPSSGQPETRSAVAERLKSDYNLDLDPQQEVVICHGASAAIYLTIRALIDTGEEVLRPNPGWGQYDGVIIDAGGVPVLYPLLPEKGFSIDFDALSSLVSPKTKAIIINSPSNPTGAVLDKEQLEKLLNFAQERDLIIISDEAYDKIVFEEQHVPIAALDRNKDRVITVGSCSKNYAMCGWRIGYAVGMPEIMAQVNKLQSLVNICPNQLSEKAAEIAFNGTQDPVYKMKDIYKQRRDFFVQGLHEIPGMKCDLPAGAFYAFVDISDYQMKDWDFTRFLIEKVGVTCIPGSAFGSAGSGFVRFSFATSQENLAEGLKRMKLHLPKLLS